jgi:arylsulfatase A-like enzyme
VLIFTDDQGYEDLGCFGSPLIETPYIDEMAQQGMKFTDFYVAASVCTPSRAALMTGCYPPRVGFQDENVIFWPSDPRGMNPSEITIAEMLKSRGYATGCFGKWHLGEKEPFLPTSQGFDTYLGIPYSNDMNPTSLYLDDRIIEEPANQNTLTRRYTDAAIDFIQDNKDRPFFCYVPHTMPHVPLAASEQFDGTSERGAYGDAIEEIDYNTGRIIQTLRDLDLEENTLVIFTSDNGPWLRKGLNGGSADPLRGGKASTWEGGMREPCVMWWPGTIPAGTECSEMATAMDLLPTFAAFAGIDLARIYPDDRVIDGMDISGLLRTEGASSPRDILLYYREARVQAIRKGKWKYHTERDELYDLENDISESNDVKASHPDVVTELETLADDMHNEIFANARQWGNINDKNWTVPTRHHEVITEADRHRSGAATLQNVQEKVDAYVNRR